MLYAKNFLVQTLDSILKIDHLATLTLIGETVKNKKEAIKKLCLLKQTTLKMLFP